QLGGDRIVHGGPRQMFFFDHLANEFGNHGLFGSRGGQLLSQQSGRGQQDSRQSGGPCSSSRRRPHRSDLPSRREVASIASAAKSPPRRKFSIVDPIEFCGFAARGFPFRKPVF